MKVYILSMLILYSVYHKQIMYILQNIVSERQA